MDAAANDAANLAAGNARNPFASLAAGTPSSTAPVTGTEAPAASAAPAVPNTSPLPNPWAPAATQPLGGVALNLNLRLLIDRIRYPVFRTSPR